MEKATFTKVMTTFGGKTATFGVMIATFGIDAEALADMISEAIIKQFHFII